MFQKAGRFDTPQVSRWISQLALQAFVTLAIAFGLLIPTARNCDSLGIPKSVKL